MSDTTDNMPGVGSLFTDPRRIASDARLVARAAKERWPIASKVRENLVTALANLAIRTYGDDPKGSKANARDFNAIMRTIAAIDSLNLRQQEIEQRALELGVADGTAPTKRIVIPPIYTKPTPGAPPDDSGNAADADADDPE